MSLGTTKVATILFVTAGSILITIILAAYVYIRISWHRRRPHLIDPNNIELDTRILQEQLGIPAPAHFA